MRYALRRLRRAPGFACAVILTLALGAAFSTAVFGIVRAVAARVVPSIDLSHLWVVRVRSTMNGLDQLGLPLREYQRVAAPLADAGITAAASDPREQMVVSAAGRAERVQVEAVSGSYARVFGLRPDAGRWIDVADDEGDGRAVAVSARDCGATGSVQTGPSSAASPSRSTARGSASLASPPMIFAVCSRPSHRRKSGFLKAPSTIFTRRAIRFRPQCGSSP